METNKTMSNEIKDLALALSTAQGAMENAKKDSSNPFFKSKYADLASIITAGKKAMVDNGLAIAQTMEANAEMAVVITTLMHKSGQWIKSVIALKPTAQTPQAMGSAITYARRYGYQAILGLSAEDDDGNTASETGVKGGASKSEHYCELHKTEMTERGGSKWDHRRKMNEKYEFDEKGNWYWCQGNGWHLSAIQ